MKRNQTSKDLRGQKHPWDKWHVEFLVGNFIDGADFLRFKNIDPERNGNARRKVEGWVRERSEIGQRARDNAKQQLEQEITEADLKAKRDAIQKYQSLFSYLDRHMEWTALTPAQQEAAIRRAELGGKGLLPKLTPNEFETVLKAARMVLGLSTSLTEGKYNVQGNFTVTDFVKKVNADKRTSTRAH